MKGKREKGVKYWGYGRHRSIPSVKLNWKHREPFACSRNFHAWLYYTLLFYYIMIVNSKVKFSTFHIKVKFIRASNVYNVVNEK